MYKEKFLRELREWAGNSRRRTIEAKLFLEAIESINFNDKSFQDFKWNYCNSKFIMETKFEDYKKIGFFINEFDSEYEGNNNLLNDTLRNFINESSELYSENYNIIFLIIRNGINPENYEDDYCIQFKDIMVYRNREKPFTTIFEVPKLKI